MLNNQRILVKPSRYIVGLIVWTICIFVINGCASEWQLSRAEVKKLKDICARLNNSALGDTVWKELDPYLVKSDALKHLQVACSYSCNGTLALKDGYFIDYVYLRGIQRFGTWQSRPNEINAIELRRGKKIIVSIGHGPDRPR
jgi:hypothetical protein